MSVVGGKADMELPMSVFLLFTSAFGGKADEKGLKADMESPMSVFPLIMSVIGGKADIIRVRQYVR